MNYLIVGGARSGKSSLAEKVAAQQSVLSTKQVLYLATAQAFDDEMQRRIARHQQDRPSAWQTVEQPLDISAVIRANEDKVILVDCLTLWLNNLLCQKHAPSDEQIQHYIDDLSVAIKAHGNVVTVSNEVGCGVIPMGELSRCFVDWSGRCNQQLAAICDNVCLVQIGIPQVLKGALP